MKCVMCLGMLNYAGEVGKACKASAAVMMTAVASVAKSHSHSC